MNSSESMSEPGGVAKNESQVLKANILNLLNKSTIKCIGGKILILGSESSGYQLNLYFDASRSSFSGFLRENTIEDKIELGPKLVKVFFKQYLNDVFEPESNSELAEGQSFLNLKTALE